MQFIDPDTAAAIGERVIREALEDFERERARRQPMTEQQADAMLEARSGLKNGYLESLALADWKGFHYTVDEFIAEHGLDVKRDTLPYWELCRSVVKAAADGERIAESRMVNDIEGEEVVLAKYRREVSHDVAEITPRAEKPAQPKPRKKKRFADHLEEFQRDKLELGEWGHVTAEQQTSRNQCFVDLMGNMPLDEIEPSTVRDYRRQLGQLPTHRNKRKEYRNKTAVELVDMEIPESHLISPRTVGEYLEVLSSYLSWCVQLDYAKSNPAREIRKPKWKQNPRTPFELQELCSLLLNNDMKGGRMGRGWRHWAPLVALFSGMRASEIAQLRVADIRGREKHEPFLSINEEDGKKLKTDHAERDIPVHSELIALGFLDYVSHIERKGHARLFPDLKVPKDRPHKNLSRWFSEYRLLYGIGEDDDTKQFHSFRGTARSAMGRAGVPKPHMDEVMGHAPEGTGERHYQHGYTFEQHQSAVEAVQFDGLDLSPLRDVWKKYI